MKLRVILYSSVFESDDRLSETHIRRRVILECVALHCGICPRCNHQGTRQIALIPQEPDREVIELY